MFFGWYIVAASFLILGYNSFFYVYGFTSFIDPIVSTSGWSFTQVTLSISIRSITSGILSPLLGFIVDRFPARTLLLIGSIVVGFGYLILSRTTSLAMFYAGFIVIGLGGTLALQLVPQVSVARWFNKNLGKANGIMGFSIALGGVAVPLLVMSIDSYGWQTTFLFGAVGTWALMIPLSFLFRDRPEEYGLAPDGVPAAEKPASPDVRISGMGVKETLRTKTFWLLGAGTLVQAGGSLALLTYLMPYLIRAGMERSTAGLVVMTVALVGLAVRVPIGWLMDVSNRRNVIAMTIGFSSVSLFLMPLIGAGSPFVLILAFAVAYGIGNGGLWVRSAIVREYFGVRSFGAISGIFSIFLIIGASSFPALTGLVFDAVGDYEPAFLTWCALNVIGALLTLAIPRSPGDLGETVEYPEPGITPA
jgi:MFS family permease